MKKYLIILFLFFLNNLSATNYPNSSPETDRTTNVFYTIQSFSGTTADNIGDAIDGLCWCRAGFSLTGTGTVTMCNEIPVDREIFLSDRVALDLFKDLILSGSVRLGKSGNIVSGISTRLESSIVLTGPFDLGANTLRFVSGPGFIDGNSNFIDFRKGGIITINSPGYELLIRNAELRAVRTSRLTPAKGGSLGLKDALIRLDGDYMATTATTSLNIYGDVVVTGTYVFTVDGACNIYDESCLYFDIGTTLKIGSNATFNFKGSKRGSIYFNGSNIDISSKNFSINSGAIFFENEVVIDDSDNYKDFICERYNSANILGGARVILDGTTTFSVL